MAGRDSQGRPLASWILIALIFILGIGAIISGPMLFLAPDGHLMQWTVDDLKGAFIP